MELADIRQAIIEDVANRDFTNKGIAPLFQAPSTAKILIIGQAPGLKTQEKGRLFDDASGDNLRQWLGVDRQTFYESGHFAILPMDFYYPGKGKSGDLPPRKDFAPKWHPLILDQLPELELTLLVGNYAQEYYLEKSQRNLTERVKHADDYLPTYFPLPHPSPRNNIWQAKNPWFQAEIIPNLQNILMKILEK
ncbi:uracil-DNA glycosylase family protein [Streptococcus suis]|uniref:uracil-DNA glycosylase family protein n=1 Tax=Streptococcus suis TaxID=1307 RepID=UPI00211C6FA0|nr:uracil-DNA glycosylase family protein [Streptococcus suis]MCQ9226453.1 uracil-DNA glycosylase family protein [Streptococcus suis]MCQ9228752.1 uracil-DNA glycosylase family protein [Streptococcus suis]MCQ9242758.1 uracil-DNA glycosylase family protein [Streptococcus suis]MCQ9275016.1 uracil-DNA glycosylase family protein [Streptococcus suis]MDE7535986.1 uracil-DNA glycosylase family protein [Streptococcus suis]